MPKNRLVPDSFVLRKDRPMQYKVKNILLIITFLAISSPAFACNGTEDDWLQTLHTHNYTVTGPFNIEEMESYNLVRIDKQWLAFGNQNNEWLEMKNRYKTGDNFYSVKFESSRWMTAQHFLIRDNCIIKTLDVAIS